MLGILLKSTSNFTGSGAWSDSESILIVSFTLSAVSPHPFSKPNSFRLNINLQSAIQDFHEIGFQQTWMFYGNKEYLCWKPWYGVSLGNPETTTSATINADLSLGTESRAWLIIRFCTLQHEQHDHQFQALIPSFGVLLMLFFNIFFVQKYIKIIYFLFFKIIFDINTSKWSKNTNFLI